MIRKTEIQETSNTPFHHSRVTPASARQWMGGGIPCLWSLQWETALMGGLDWLYACEALYPKLGRAKLSHNCHKSDIRTEQWNEAFIKLWMWLFVVCLI